MLARRIAMGSAMALLTAAATGCGAILEEAAEQALEQEGVDVEFDEFEEGGEININVEGEDGESGSLVIDGDEGTIEFETEGGDGSGSVQIDGEEGTFDFETEDGEGSFAVDAGLPDGWPDAFPLPDSATVATSGTFEENGERSFVATFEGPADAYEDYVAHFRGFDAPIQNEFEGSNGDGQQLAITWGTDAEQQGSLLVTTDGTATFGHIQMIG